MTSDPRVPSPGPPVADDPDGGPRPDTTDPHRARERALKVLFQSDVRKVSPVDVLRRISTDPASLDLLDATDQDAEAAPGPGGRIRHGAKDRRNAPLDGYSRALVLGVADHLEELDAVLDELAEGWTVSRMPVVDRNILRLGAYELMHEDTPAAVVISEAIGFAKQLSTERSHRFVNGVLEAVRRVASQKTVPRSGSDGDAEEPDRTRW